jgi:large subunit ribosomal protein L25
MEFQKLTIQERSERGKGPARRLRAKGLVPGVIYGHELKSTAVAFDGKLLRKALANEYGLNSVLSLQFGEGGKQVLAMVQEHHTHALTRDLLHVDFITVDENRPVEVRIPVITTGKPKGEELGGRLLLVFREVPMRCLPAKIPLKVEVDVTELGIGNSIKAGQLKLAEGVKLVLDPLQTVVAVVAPEAEPVAEEAAAAVEGAPVEGAPAVPGAPGAAPGAPGAAPGAPGAAPGKPGAPGAAPGKPGAAGAAPGKPGAAPAAGAAAPAAGKAPEAKGKPGKH